MLLKIHQFLKIFFLCASANSLVLADCMDLLFYFQFPFRIITANFLGNFMKHFLVVSKTLFFIYCLETLIFFLPIIDLPKKFFSFFGISVHTCTETPVQLVFHECLFISAPSLSMQVYSFLELFHLQSVKFPSVFKTSP